MKKMVSKAMLLLGTVFCAFSLFTVNVEAKGDDTLKKGVYAEEISLAGMTEEEAAEAINAYVDSLKEAEITLLAAGDNEVTVTAGELGLYRHYRRGKRARHARQCGAAIQGAEGFRA